MRIKFNRAYAFSENGYEFVEFVEGREYEVSESCGQSAVQEGVAEEVRGCSGVGAGRKNKGDAPRNKAK